MRAFVGAQFSRRWGTAALSLACGVSLAIASGGAAAEWSADLLVQNDVKYDDNILLEPEPEGWVAGDILRPTLRLANKQSTQSVTFDLGGQFEFYTGPGATSDFDRSDPDLVFTGQKSWSLSKLGVTARYLEQPTRTSELEESGVTTQAATRRTVRAGTNLDVKVSARNSFALSAAATDVTFTGPGESFTPFRSYDFNGTWSWALSADDDVGVTLGLTLFKPETAGGAETKTYRLTAKHTMRRTEALTFRGAAGANLVKRESTTGASADSSTVGFRLDSGLTYKVGVTALNVDLLQDVVPGSEGEVQQNRVLRLGLRHALNSRIDLGLNASYFSRLPDISVLGLGKTERDVMTVQPSVSWKIVPTVSLSLSYRFIYEDAVEEGTAKSNAVFATFSIEQNLFQ